MPNPVQSADHRPNPRSFKPDLDVLSAAVRSLSFCPFGEGYMLAGSDDGSVRLHATTNERPLITWPGTVDGQPIVKLVWSTSRPCVFVVLDTASRIHLWDLGSGRNEAQKLSGIKITFNTVLPVQVIFIRRTRYSSRRRSRQSP